MWTVRAKGEEAKVICFEKNHRKKQRIALSKREHNSTRTSKITRNKAQNSKYLHAKSKKLYTSQKTIAIAKSHTTEANTTERETRQAKRWYVDMTGVGKTFHSSDAHAV